MSASALRLKSSALIAALAGTFLLVATVPGRAQDGSRSAARPSVEVDTSVIDALGQAPAPNAAGQGVVKLHPPQHAANAAVAPTPRAGRRTAKPAHEPGSKAVARAPAKPATAHAASAAAPTANPSGSPRLRPAALRPELGDSASAAGRPFDPSTSSGGSGEGSASAGAMAGIATTAAPQPGAPPPDRQAAAVPAPSSDAAAVPPAPTQPPATATPAQPAAPAGQPAQAASPTQAAAPAQTASAETVAPPKPAPASPGPVIPASLPPQGGLPAQVLFSPNATDLPDHARGTLDAVVNAMQRDEQVRIQVVAFASGVPDQASQARRVSLSRAVAVRSYLIEHGVRSTRIDVRALGSRPDGGGAPDRVDIVALER